MIKLKNWKTTFFGISSFLSGVVMLLKGNIPEGCAVILSGLGLVSAKDHDQ